MDPTTWGLNVIEPVRVYLSDRDHSVFALIDEQDADRVLSRRWYASSDGHTKVYARGTRKPHTYLHCFVMLKVKRPSRSHVIVDHKDGDGLNCTRSNLEWETPTGNSRNRHGYKHHQLWLFREDKGDGRAQVE